MSNFQVSGILLWLYGTNRFFKLLISLTSVYSPVERAVICYVALVTCILVCMPFWPPLMIISGFVNSESLLFAICLNFSAYLTSA